MFISIDKMYQKKKKAFSELLAYDLFITNITVIIRYRISSVIRRSFFLPKQSQKSRSVLQRSILQDRSRSLGLFRKGQTRIIAKFPRADLVICSHSREGETPSYNQINMVSQTICTFNVCMCKCVCVCHLC